MEKISGVIFDGKVYEVVETDELTCNGCVFKGEKCKEIPFPCADRILDNTAIYRYSQELTDRLKGGTNGERL